MAMALTPTIPGIRAGMILGPCGIHPIIPIGIILGGVTATILLYHTGAGTTLPGGVLVGAGIIITDGTTGATGMEVIGPEMS